MRCQKLFNSWVEALKDEPGLWVIRDIARGTVWNSPEVVESFGLDSPYSTWRNTLAYTNPDDVARIEDAHSKALKLGGVHHFTVRGKITATRQEWFACACKAVHCRKHNPPCSIILYSAEVVSADESRPEFH